VDQDIWPQGLGTRAARCIVQSQNQQKLLFATENIQFAKEPPLRNGIEEQIVELSSHCTMAQVTTHWLRRLSENCNPPFNPLLGFASCVFNRVSGSAKIRILDPENPIRRKCIVEP
jgi:hypothetical protein